MSKGPRNQICVQNWPDGPNARRRRRQYNIIVGDDNEDWSRHRHGDSKLEPRGGVGAVIDYRKNDCGLLNRHFDRGEQRGARRNLSFW